MPAARSKSRGRPASKGRAPATPKTPKEEPAKAAEPAPEKSKMEFEEGNEVMSKWPGTQLYFKSKVTFVRDDDNEYDVQYEDGTIFTIKAKDVKKRSIADDKSAKKATPSRSR